jgi:phage shock protein PspC (stress-responsive transcriptional regulator)
MDDYKPRSERLYRSRQDRMVSGVCGGLAQYFNVDPVLVRVAFVALGVATGVGLLAYIILAIVVPERPSDEPEPVGGTSARRGGGEAFAYILVFLGAWILVNNMGLLNFINADLFWPILLIGIGGFLLLQRARE